MFLSSISFAAHRRPPSRVCVWAFYGRFGPWCHVLTVCPVGEGPIILPQWNKNVGLPYKKKKKKKLVEIVSSNVLETMFVLHKSEHLLTTKKRLPLWMNKKISAPNFSASYLEIYKHQRTNNYSTLLVHVSIADFISSLPKDVWTITCPKYISVEE